MQRRFARVFRDEKPDAVLSFTIKNNVFGASAAKSAKVPFLPNVTGLGTAFLSGIFGMAGGLVLMGLLAWLLPVTTALALHGTIQFASNIWRAPPHPARCSPWA